MYILFKTRYAILNSDWLKTLHTKCLWLHTLSQIDETRIEIDYTWLAGLWYNTSH